MNVTYLELKVPAIALTVAPAHKKIFHYIYDTVYSAYDDLL